MAASVNPKSTHEQKHLNDERRSIEVQTSCLGEHGAGAPPTQREPGLDKNR